MKLGTARSDTIPKPLSTFAAKSDGHVAFRDLNRHFVDWSEPIALIELNPRARHGAARGTSPKPGFQSSQFATARAEGDIFKMDAKILDLFREWLSAFEEIQRRSSNGETSLADARLREIEVRVAATPAEGIQGLAIKLGLHQFLIAHADTASVLYESAYLDLVRLACRDPAAEIAARGQWPSRSATTELPS